ncbi:MAG: hypothetical protein OT477_14095 [Chloroflexi bacterium]|nr:hypothetical protein [Chloroflexota bacterium]
MNTPNAHKLPIIMVIPVLVFCIALTINTINHACPSYQIGNCWPIWLLALAGFASGCVIKLAINSRINRLQIPVKDDVIEQSKTKPENKFSLAMSKASVRVLLTALLMGTSLLFRYGLVIAFFSFGAGVTLIALLVDIAEE